MNGTSKPSASPETALPLPPEAEGDGRWSGNLASIDLDRDGRLRRYSPSAATLFPLLPGDIGFSLGEIFHKSGAPSVSAAASDGPFVDLFADISADILGVLAGQVACRREVESGDGRLYQRHTALRSGADGAADGVTISFLELDAGVLQEARLYAEAIVNSVREPLIVLDGDLCVHSINQPFSDLFQVRATDVLGQPLGDLDKGVWEIPELLSRLRAVLDTGAAMDSFEVPYRSTLLGPRALLLNARPLSRRSVRPKMILVAIDDVTDRRAIEGLLRRNESRRREEERVRQRQLQLASALRVSTVGELTTALAHELNQPLSSISLGVEACAQNLRSGMLDPQRHLAMLADIASETVRAAGIISRLRSFVDKGEANLEEVDLRDIVGGIPHLLQKELESSSVTLHIEVSPEPLPVIADRIQVEQVLVNLIQNAIQSIDEADGQERRIDLGVRIAGAMAEFRVRDTGTGVSEPAAEKMFRPFFTTKRHGLGMGLALSRSILESHQGRIWMKSPLDGGAGIVVCFTLPLRRSGRRAAELEQDPERGLGEVLATDPTGDPAQDVEGRMEGGKP